MFYSQSIHLVAEINKRRSIMKVLNEFIHLMNKYEFIMISPAHIFHAWNIYLQISLWFSE